MNARPEIVTCTAPSVMKRTTSRIPNAMTGDSPAPVSKWNWDWWIDPCAGPMTVQYRSAPRSALGACRVEKT